MVTVIIFIRPKVITFNNFYCILQFMTLLSFIEFYFYIFANGSESSMPCFNVYQMSSGIYAFSFFTASNSIKLDRFATRHKIYFADTNPIKLKSITEYEIFYYRKLKRFMKRKILVCVVHKFQISEKNQFYYRIVP